MKIDTRIVIVVGLMSLCLIACIPPDSGPGEMAATVAEDSVRAISASDLTATFRREVIIGGELTIVEEAIGSPHFSHKAGQERGGTVMYHAMLDLWPEMSDDYRRFEQVTFHIRYADGDSLARSGWTVNIGDSQSNDGDGGDAGDQANDSELQIHDGLFRLFASDTGMNEMLIENDNPFPPGETAIFTIRNNYLGYGIENGKWYNFSNPNIFALRGQVDRQGPINYKIFAGINRTIGDFTKTGVGVVKTTIRFEGEINGTPAFEPDYWNNLYWIKYGNNCYNYATNKRTDRWAIPGEGGGYYLGRDYTETNLINATVADGLEYIGKIKPTPTYRKGKSLVVLFNGSTDVDFHFYRLDRDGESSWSHKMSGEDATNLDKNHIPITDPETAARGGFYNLVGYFWVDSDYDQGVGHENIDMPLD